MKKIISVILVLVVLMLGMTACSQNTTEFENATNPTNSTSNETISNTNIPGTSRVPSATAHVHKYKSATCEKPETCTLCGDTYGEPLGHVWNQATCTSPKICGDCRKTEGVALQHTYKDGKCSVCGAKDPSVPVVEMVWIPTNGGKKYHSRKTCSNMIDPEYVTREEAEQRGFTDCKKC